MTPRNGDPTVKEILNDQNLRLDRIYDRIGAVQADVNDVAQRVSRIEGEQAARAVEETHEVAVSSARGVWAAAAVGALSGLGSLVWQAVAHFVR